MIKKISSEQKKKGTFNGLKGVFGEAKKEWDIIKRGEHELYSVGKQQPAKTNGIKRHNKNKNKTRKNKMKLCDKCKLCEKCIIRNGL